MFVEIAKRFALSPANEFHASLKTLSFDCAKIRGAAVMRRKHQVHES